MLGKPIVPPFARTERDLVCAAQTGNPQAVAYLIAKYEPVRSLIWWQMRKLDPAGRHHDEMRAAANLALLEALPNFDVLRGVKFTTYAYHYIRGAMLKALFPDQRSSSDETTPRLRLISLDGSPTADTDEADDDYGFERELFARDAQYGIDLGLDRALNSDRNAAVRRFVSSLGDGQRGIVVDLFWHNKTHAEIARQHGVSRPAISRALARAYSHGRAELAAYQPALAA